MTQQEYVQKIIKDDTFGCTWWNNDDIRQEIEERTNKKATIDDVAMVRQLINEDQLIEVMIEAGWHYINGVIDRLSFDDLPTEAVEVCPYCEHENIFRDYNVDIDGYVVKCQHCGKEIFLCDECLHNEDNPDGECNWCNQKMLYADGKATEEYGMCMRGVTVNEVTNND